MSDRVVIIMGSLVLCAMFLLAYMNLRSNEPPNPDTMTYNEFLRACPDHWVTEGMKPGAAEDYCMEVLIYRSTER